MGKLRDLYNHFTKISIPKGEMTFKAKPLSGPAPTGKPRISLLEKPVRYVGIQPHLFTRADIDRTVIIRAGRQDPSRAQNSA